MKNEIVTGIVCSILVFLIMIFIGFIVLKNLEQKTKEFEENCSRYSVNNETDNCMCPCDVPSKFQVLIGRFGIITYSTLCDGWNVKKNEPCLTGVKSAS